MESLSNFAAQHDIQSGWVRGIGAFERVALTQYDQVEKNYLPGRVFEGAMEILNLGGNLSLRDDEVFPHIHVSLSRETDNGVEVLGGHLVEGVVFACELYIQAFDDISLERCEDEDTGLALWGASSGIEIDSSTVGAEHASAVSRRAIKGTPSEALKSRAQPSRQELDASNADSAMPVGWGAVAAASNALEQASSPASIEIPARRGRKKSLRKQAAEASVPAFVPDPVSGRPRPKVEPLEDRVPERGDWVEHQQFGLCRVDRETEGGSVILRLPSGSRKAIKLDYLEVLNPRFDSGRTIYPLRPKRKRSEP